MRLSKTLFSASLLVAAAAQSSITTNDTSDGLVSSTSTSSAPETTITVGPEVCSSAGFDHCYNIISVLTPTVYVIITVSDSASAGGAEPITSGDPILTQTDNIITATDESITAPTTALVRINYSESTGTTCFPATVTSTLTGSDLQCLQATGAPFFSEPPQVTKTRVVIKAREDDTQGKGTDSGNGSTATPNVNPGPSTDTNMAVNTGTSAAPGPTNNVPTQAAPTDNGASNTEGPPQPTGQATNEQGKSIVSTSFTTIAEVSNGSTKFITSAVATMTQPAPPTGTTGGSGSGAGPNRIVNAEFLLGALGFAAVIGL
ncbi:hypothetical protein TWF694_007687 [Orbilia ellipsospora]|uniref:Uncharacterized protein n=1 Tax=Orbilia ellipsospora TaxID=2528407 RepID=A0AAV9XK65_9PEZI